MNLNAMLSGKGIDPATVIVFRHCPPEKTVRKILPWLAAERPELFNAYQQTHGDVRVESALRTLVGRGHVAAFIGIDPGRAVFAGLYAVSSSQPIAMQAMRQNSVDRSLRALGATDWFTEERARERPVVHWFDLVLTDFYPQWKGRLVVGWTPPERSWWRRAHKNDLPVVAIHEESVFEENMPEWSALNLEWQQLALLPTRWKLVLSQWRGVYYIFDEADGKGYVGAAYGKENILGRWLDYSRTGDGGNRRLRERAPDRFRFSILQLVAPDMEPAEVVRLENRWKDRLHTRAPYGLNEN